MTVWLIAAGGLTDKVALENYGKTLTAPISKTRLDLLPTLVTLPHGDVYAWGFPRTKKGGNERKFHKIAVGDVCFFSTTQCVGPKKDWVNRYHWVARVAGTVDIKHAMDVSNALWDSDGFYPYFLERPIAIEVDFEAFGAEIDPSGRFYKGSPQSSSPLTSFDKLSHVLQTYGSVDSWAADYIERLTSLSPIATQNTKSRDIAGNSQIQNAIARKVSYRDKLPAMREWLIRIAKVEQCVTYANVMEVFDVDRLTLNHCMDRLSEQCVDNAEPVLTALIVSKRNGRSSEGLHKFGVVNDEAERQSLYRYWSDKEITAVTPPSIPTTLEVRAARFASVEVRPDQAAFRRRVFTACQGRCVISGCSAEQALDAAHRHGKDWRMGHNNACDGLLLRKDLHALYDSNMLIISDEGLVVILPEVLEDYQCFSGIIVTAAEQ